MMNSKNYGTILIVDDDTDVRNFISALLNTHGYKVISCGSAEDALKKLYNERIDVVLTDIVMPKVSGTALLEKVRDKTSEVPVILMTGYTDFDTAVEAIKKGVFDFVIKPFNPEQILHSLEKALNFKRLTEMEKNYKYLLEEFNQEIETLITERTMNLMALTVADRVRNPATVIGYIGKKMLQRKDISQDFKGNLECIIKETEKLQNIVSDFHGLLKTKESQFKYEDINEVVENVVSTVDKQNVKTILQLAEGPLKINMQKSLLKVAMYLILRNSIEATPQGGTISVATYQDKDGVVLQISDSGYGMSQEVIDKIFDPFFSTKERRFGMGLPLVKQIVTEHLGEIQVESKVGSGTTFHMKFPFRWTKNI
jgi:signal transduction histidine kinase